MYDYKTEVNNAYNTVAANDDNVYTVNTDGLTFDDNPHYDSEGLDNIAFKVVDLIIQEKLSER